MGTLNPKYYLTSDKKILINLDDISFLSLNQANNVFDSYMQIYMKGNNNAINVKYSDGLQIINILAVRDDCKIYWDKALYDSNTNNNCFVVPKEQSSEYIMNIKSVKSGSVDDKCPSITEIQTATTDYIDVCYKPTKEIN